MEKTLIQLFEAGKSTAEAVSKLTVTEVTSLMEGSVTRGKGDPVMLLQALLSGLTAEEEDNVEAGEKTLALYLSLLDILLKNELNAKLSSNLVGILMLQADGLSATALAEIANKYTEAVKSGSLQGGRALDLFATVLSALGSRERVTYGDSCMKGAEYKSHVLNSLCSCKWSSKSVLHLTTMLKDATLSGEEMKFVVEKVLRLMPELHLHDLPALVYQLLLLAAKGHQRTVLEGISNFFIDLDNRQREKGNMVESEDLLSEGEADVETLRHTEGTIILHFVLAIRLDHDLGREYIKYMKGGQLCSSARVLSPFNLALGLSLSRIRRFEDQIFDFWKAAIVKSFKSQEKKQQSLLVRGNIPEEVGIEDVVLETVENSKYGWDHVLQGLVQLGFTMMDAFGPKTAFGREVAHTGPDTPTQKACKLGTKMILKTFTAHEAVRSEVLKQIINRVIVVTKSTAPVSHFLELLGKLVVAEPMLLLQSAPRLREAVQHLNQLPLSAAAGLLSAIHPLLKLNRPLRDSLLLALRKALFNRQLDARKVSVTGYLSILKHFRVQGSLPSSQASLPFMLSQVQADTHQYNATTNEPLCLEILANLRRCSSQQADVRLLLYQGLCEVMRKNSQLQGPILDLLSSQLKQYYETSEDVNPPVKLQPCITAQGDQIFLAEPLSHLLASVQECVLLSRRLQQQRAPSGNVDDEDNDEELEELLTHLEACLKSLTRRMIKSEMEDFELDKSADFSAGNSVGVRNSIFALLVIGIYEVLMEYTFISGKYSEESCREMVQLFSHYQQLSQVLREKAGAGGSKRGRPSGGKAPTTLLSLSFTLDILKALLSDNSPRHQGALDILRGEKTLLPHLVGVAQQKLHQVAGSQPAGEVTPALKQCFTLARLFLTHYMESQVAGEARRERIKGVAGQCLDSVLTVVSTATDRGLNSLLQCLTHLEREVVEDEKEEPIDNPSEKIHTHVKKFQRLVANVLSADEEQCSWKEVGCLLSIISALTTHLPPASAQFQQVYHWAHKLCSEQTIDDLATCKLLLGCLLDLGRQQTDLPQLLQHLAQDIHTQLADIDQTVNLEDQTHLAVVTERVAAPTALLLLLSHLERDLEDVEWVMSQIKAARLQDSPAQDGLSTQQESQEAALCGRLVQLLLACHELVQSAVPPGPCVDGMFRTLTRLYNTLTQLAKFYVSLYTSHRGSLPAAFEKLVKHIGVHLTPFVYNFITYTQTAEAENLQQTLDKGSKKEKGSKKDKKKAAAPAGVSKAKVMKQAKNIPNLVFAIEQMERFLIQLSKKSKVDLMRHMKMSTSRDFRISTAALQAAKERQEEEDEEEEDEEEEGEDGDQGSGEQEEDGSPVASARGDDSEEENQEPSSSPQASKEESAPKKRKLARKKKT